MVEQMDFVDWLQYGIDAGWVSELACGTHDGIPWTEEEAAEFEEGYDPCQPVLRVW